jgi:hypothetical protein
MAFTATSRLLHDGADAHHQLRGARDRHRPVRPRPGSQAGDCRYAAKTGLSNIKIRDPLLEADDGVVVVQDLHQRAYGYDVRASVCEKGAIALTRRVSSAAFRAAGLCLPE